MNQTAIRLTASLYKDVENSPESTIQCSNQAVVPTSFIGFMLVKLNETFLNA
jgi:hypothetical protein